MSVFKPTDSTPNGTREDRVRELVRRFVRVETTVTAELQGSDTASEADEADRLLREAFSTLGPLSPSVSLAESVLLRARAEGLTARSFWRSPRFRSAAVGLAAVLLLVSGSALAVMATMTSAALGSFGVAGSAVWSSRAVVFLIEFLDRLGSSLTGAGEIARAVLLGEAAPAVAFSLLVCCVVVLFGFALVVRSTQPAPGEETWP